MDPQVAITRAEAALLQAIRDNLDVEEIASLANKGVRTFAVLNLIQSVRAYLELNRTEQPVHIKGDGLDETNTTNIERVSWDDVTRHGDWEDIYPGIELITTYGAATALGCSQPTVLNWIKQGRLLAFERKGRRGFRLPAEQIHNGQPLNGMAELVGIIGSPSLVWRYLTRAVDFGEQLARPIDRLKNGTEKDIQTILLAARSFASDFA